MRPRMAPHCFGAVAALATVLLAGPRPATAQSGSSFTNLQVLPEDISRRELNAAMLANLRGLGLPRRQNQGCLHCHVGNMEQPVDDWDFASDEKATKRKARVMMAMVAAINEQHLSELDDRIDPPVRVTCYTCHAGRTDPRPLAAVLAAAYRAGGIDSAVTKYNALRDRYFGADAYDFRVGVLSGMAMQLAATGAFDDALVLADLNGNVYPDEPSARGTWLLIGLQRAAESDVAAALDEFDRIKLGADAALVSPALLDALGWTLFRRDRQADALAVFRKNLAQFPDEYIPNESLADALWISGDHETPIQMYEAWLERHPDHAMARRRLTNLRSRR